MKNVRQNLRAWALGATVALAGVALARLGPPAVADSFRPVVVAAGRLLATTGLFLIALGVRRRLRHAASDAPPGA